MDVVHVAHQLDCVEPIRFRTQAHDGIDNAARSCIWEGSLNRWSGQCRYLPFVNDVSSFGVWFEVELAPFIMSSFTRPVSGPSPICLQ